MFLIRALYAPSWGARCFVEWSPFRCPCRCTTLTLSSYRAIRFCMFPRNWWQRLKLSVSSISFASLASVRIDLAPAFLVCMCPCVCVCVCFLWLEESANTDDQNSCCCWLVSKHSCSTLATPWTVVARLLFQEISQARILEWVAISFPGGSSRPRDWTLVSYTVRQFLYGWATREAQSEFLGFLYSKVKLSMVVLPEILPS